MRLPVSSNLVDWTAVTLRWLMLLGVALTFRTLAPESYFGIFIIVVAGLWNTFLTILVSMDRRVWGHPYLCVAADGFIALLIFFIGGGFTGNLGWVGLLPLVSAAVYFRLKGVLLLTPITLFMQGGLGSFFQAFTAITPSLVMLLPVYLFVGTLIVFLFTFNKEKPVQVQNPPITPSTSERKSPGEVYKLISSLNASLNYQRVLDTALDISSSALTNSNGLESLLVSAVMLYTQNHQNGAELHVGSARRFAPTDLRIHLPAVSGLLQRAIEVGEPQLTMRLSKDPELSRVVSYRACQSAYCFPLRSGLDTYGVLVFGHPDKDFFSTERREILDVIGSQAVVAIQNARLYHDLEVEKERMMEIQEEARKKLARDLHDGPTQSVAALAMRANLARRLIDRNLPAAVEELFKIEEMARHTTKEIRHMLFTLRPLVLESQGLIAALESMAEKMRETYDQNVIIEADESVIPDLEMGKQAVIFYIAEEAINNARKHAQAGHIRVSLKPASQGVVLLEIVDDGIGFDPGAVKDNYENRGSLGMVNMRERTELVNGVMQVDTSPGKGTRIRVWVPFTEEAADRLRRGT